MSSTVTDPQRPTTWRKFQAGMCKGCKAGCCHLPVEVSVRDLIRLGLTCEEEAATSLKELSKRLLKEKVIQAFHAKSQIFVLSQFSDDACIFLEKDPTGGSRCSVYSKRPEVCRRFPTIGPRPGFCPASYARKSSNSKIF